MALYSRRNTTVYIDFIIIFCSISSDCKKIKKEKQKVEQTNTEEKTINENIKAQTKKVIKKTETKKSDKKVKQNKNKANTIETISNVLEMLQGVPKYLIKLVNSIRINLRMYLKIGGEDAAQSALNYGKYNAVVWGLIGQASAIMKVDANDVKIDCDFENDRLVYDIKAKIKLRLITALVLGICIGFRILINNIKK